VLGQGVLLTQDVKEKNKPSEKMIQI